MYPFLRTGVMAAACLLAACQKNAGPAPAAAVKSGEPAAPPSTVALVKTEERSASFSAVNRQLELGGTLYAYVDIDGDVQKLAARLHEFLAQMSTSQPFAGIAAQQDLAGIAATLGFTDVKALGLSSVPDGSGYFRNRCFIHTAGERHGLLAALGGKPAPWKHVGLAPADAAFFGESEIDLGIAYKTLKEVVTRVAGEPVGNQLEGMLQKAGEAATLSYLDLIYGLKGRIGVVARLDPEKPWRVPGAQPLTLPGTSVLVCIENVGQIVEPSLMKLKELHRRDAGTQHIYEPARPLPLEGFAPALVVDGTMLYVATSLAFLDECRALKTGLAQTPEFQQALAQVGREGNGLSYVSPRAFAALRSIETLNPSLPAQVKSMLDFVLAQMPASDRALVSVRTNLDDGILIRSYLNRSLKQDIAAITVYNPVTVGLLAAMAIPAFQKVRVASQEKAIVNNLRQLHAAADQYYLETGKQSATLDDLVGPKHYVRQLNSVMGENYGTLRFQQGQPLRLRLPTGRVMQYPP